MKRFMKFREKDFTICKKHGILKPQSDEPGREMFRESKQLFPKKSKCFTPEKEKILWQNRGRLLP